NTSSAICKPAAIVAAVGGGAASCRGTMFTTALDTEREGRYRGARRMKQTRKLLAGPAAAVIFAATILLLPLWIPGYSSVHQTVSEIGMAGSPMQVPFTLLVCIV